MDISICFMLRDIDRTYFAEAPGICKATYMYTPSLQGIDGIGTHGSRIVLGT